MFKWLRRAALTVVVLVVLVVLAVQALRWSAYGEEERAAVALANVPPPEATGRNGFAALALSGYEIPAEEVDGALAAEVRGYRVWLERQIELMVDPSTNDHALSAWTPAVAARYPERRLLDQKSPLCPVGLGACLNFVQSNAGDVREFMEGEAARLALIDQALGADHLRSPYPPSYQAPLPPFQSLRLPMTQAAIDAVNGRVPEALARTCRTLAGARRFARDARELVDRVYHPALANGAASLLLEIRRMHPQAELPDECREALRPVTTEEIHVCEGMRGEFRMNAAFAAAQDAVLARRWTPTAVFSRTMLTDSRLYEAWIARSFAPPCSDEYRAEVLEGRLPPTPTPTVSSEELDCYAALVSCVMAEIATPDYTGYQGRLLDHAAKLRAMLAANAAIGTEPDPDALLAAASSPGYDVRVDAAARTVTVPLRFDRGKADPEFSVGY